MTIKDRIIRVMEICIHEKRKGVTNQSEFADAIGMNPNAITNIIHMPERQFTVTQIEQICKVFGISPTYIILGKGTHDLKPESEDSKTLAKIRKLLT